MTVLSHHATVFGERSDAALDAARPVGEAAILERLAELSETLPAYDAAVLVFHGG